jgi:hypothetical protein
LSIGLPAANRLIDIPTAAHNTPNSRTQT